MNKFDLTKTYWLNSKLETRIESVATLEFISYITMRNIEKK